MTLDARPAPQIHHTVVFEDPATGAAACARGAYQIAATRVGGAMRVVNG